MVAVGTHQCMTCFLRGLKQLPHPAQFDFQEDTVGLGKKCHLYKFGENRDVLGLRISNGCSFQGFFVGFQNLLESAAPELCSSALGAGVEREGINHDRATARARRWHSRAQLEKLVRTLLASRKLAVSAPPRCVMRLHPLGWAVAAQPGPCG